MGPGGRMCDYPTALCPALGQHTLSHDQATVPGNPGLLPRVPFRRASRCHRAPPAVAAASCAAPHPAGLQGGEECTAAV